MHILCAAAADGPSSYCPPRRYKSNFPYRCFMGYGGVEVSNDHNRSGTEGLTCTTIPSYHNVFVKFLDVQERQVLPYRTPTVL